MNRILNNHADWLDYNISKVEGNKCRKQAIAYAIKDERQTGVKKLTMQQFIDLATTKEK